MKNTTLNYLIVICLLFSSCASYEKMVYFQDGYGVVPNENLLNYEPKIQPGDVLSIHVSAIDMEAAIPFNLYEGSGGTIPKSIPYLVDTKGEINFPVIGKVKVEGLSNMEINNILSASLSDYIKKPIVNVRLINFKVTVLGEVKQPGTYPVPDEKISILEAIGLAGDLTIQGKRNTVLLIREEYGKRNFVTLDLTNINIFNSPYFYLSQNDIIYVEPNKTKMDSSAVGANTSILISSISTLISLIAILTR